MKIAFPFVLGFVLAFAVAGTPVIAAEPSTLATSPVATSKYVVQIDGMT